MKKMEEVGSEIGMKYLFLQDCRGAKDNFSTPSDLSLLISYVYKNENLKKYL
jgi:hypothetical protein